MNNTTALELQVIPNIKALLNIKALFASATWIWSNQRLLLGIKNKEGIKKVEHHGVVTL